MNKREMIGPVSGRGLQLGCASCPIESRLYAPTVPCPCSCEVLHGK
jgi:hypothetical protein